MQSKSHWVGTWAAAPAPSEVGVSFNNHTIRMNPRVSIGGDRLRVRISNAYGSRNLTIGAARVALREAGAGVVPGSDRKLTFGGSDGATIAAGAVSFSDPVELAVAPLADLAVSIYLPGEVPASFQITGRYARQTNYISPPGNFTQAAVMPIGSLTDQWYFLCGVDVVASNETGGVVALGELADRRQHLDDRRLLPLARPARPASCRARRPADGGDEQRPRRQPHPLRPARR